MQNPLEHLEANARPTWHGNASARTGGRGLNDCGKKDAVSSRCYLDLLISSYHSCCPFLPFLSLFRFFPPLVCLCQVIMAHPSSYISMPPDRSRSRDDPPMWSHPTPDRPRNPRHHESWNYTPLLRHTRLVLVIIDLEQVQHLMSERQSDVMQAVTLCLHLADLNSTHCSPTASW